MVRQGPYYVATLKVVSLGEDYPGVSRVVSLRSAIAANIPLKLSREIALMHEGLPVKARVIENGKNMALCEAGEWHGLQPGRYSSDFGRIRVLKTSRYRSVVQAGQWPADRDNITIKAFPDYLRVVKDLDEKIDKNIMFQYSVTPESIKGDDPEKRFIKGFCFINTAASLILPGYGSYLASGYVGVKQKDFSITGVVLSVALVFSQLTVTEMMTGFKSNFFPWIRDSDKSLAVQNLHIFCWSTLLTTYSVSFMDQLAFQYEAAKKLPPFFQYRDQAAALFSFLMPGGGLFYKGHRIAGWSFYFSEMILAGFGAYSTGANDHYIYAFSALAAVKLLDIICAYLVKPSYSVYRIEKERQISRVTLSFNILPHPDDVVVPALGVTASF